MPPSDATANATPSVPQSVVIDDDTAFTALIDTGMHISIQSSRFHGLQKVLTPALPHCMNYRRSCPIVILTTTSSNIISAPLRMFVWHHKLPLTCPYSRVPLFPDGGYIVSHTVAVLLTRNVMLPHTVVTVIMGRLKLPFVNFSFSPQVIPHGTSLATLRVTFQHMPSTEQPIVVKTTLLHYRTQNSGL